MNKATSTLIVSLAVAMTACGSKHKSKKHSAPAKPQVEFTTPTAEITTAGMETDYLLTIKLPENNKAVVHSVSVNSEKDTAGKLANRIFKQQDGTVAYVSGEFLDTVVFQKGNTAYVFGRVQPLTEKYEFIGTQDAKDQKYLASLMYNIEAYAKCDKKAGEAFSVSTAWKSFSASQGLSDSELERCVQQANEKGLAVLNYGKWRWQKESDSSKAPNPFMMPAAPAQVASKK
ncbi:MAG: hypothetical protein AB7F86_13845 [Bdellovibrionales bacterium]